MRTASSARMKSIVAAAAIAFALLPPPSVEAGGRAKRVRTALGERVLGPPRLTRGEIVVARETDAKLKATTLRRLLAPYAGPRARNKIPVEQVAELLRGATESDIADIRAAYVAEHGTDPFVHIVGGDLAQPHLSRRTRGRLGLLRLAARLVFMPWRGFKNVENWAVATYQRVIGRPAREVERTSELARLWLGPEMRARAGEVAALADKLGRGDSLTAEDRKNYYANMPFIGIRTRSNRDFNEPTLEEQVFQSEWSAYGHQSLSYILAKVEASFPVIELPKPQPGQKRVAIVVSSQGAQWQELMGYVQQMSRHGVHMQFFTPDGRPAAFQRDSLSRSNTSFLGYGAPAELDPAGAGGDVARALLGTAVGAERFNIDDFDQVYVAGGLGLNEDGVRAEPADPTDSSGRQRTAASDYRNHPAISRMINEAARKGVPVLAVCHGPSVFLAEDIEVRDSLKGVRIAALGPAEPYVAYTGRTGPAFPHLVLVHHDARRHGLLVRPVRDLIRPGGVVREVVQTPHGPWTIVTGPHPRAARTLGLAGLELLGIAAAPATYLR